MKDWTFSMGLILLISVQCSFAQIKTIHVYVALCDNEHQGIFPVPSTLGNGKDPARNLYWGAAYGVKSFFKYKTNDWEIVKVHESENPSILESVLFKHKSDSVYLLAKAYEGEKIKNCIEDFLKASNNQNRLNLEYNNHEIQFGGGSDMVAYVGHDGLMDFDVELEYQDDIRNPVDVMILACYSMRYFATEIEKAGATPILWTTHLMAPEAYTLKDAIDGWLSDESGEQIEERAAQAYHRYQKCGINGARNLFVSGF